MILRSPSGDSPSEDRRPARLPEAQGASGDSTRVFRVLFVCTGNTCRSPMAEGILRNLADDLSDRGVRIETLSAGTMGPPGMPATDLAIEVAARYGVDLNSHRSQILSAEMLDASDLVLVMAAEHYQACRKLGQRDDHVFMLKAFPDRPADLRTISIPDPIGGDRRRYESVFLEIDESLHHGLPALLRLAGYASGGANPQ